MSIYRIPDNSKKTPLGYFNGQDNDHLTDGQISGMTMHRLSSLPMDISSVFPDEVTALNYLNGKLKKKVGVPYVGQIISVGDNNKATNTKVYCINKCDRGDFGNILDCCSEIRSTTETIIPENGPLAEYLKENNITAITMGTSFTDVLKMLLCPEVWPSANSIKKGGGTINSNGQVPSTRERFVIDPVNFYLSPDYFIHNKHHYAVGTDIYIIETTAEESGIEAVAPYISGLKYGYRNSSGDEYVSTSISADVEKVEQEGEYELIVETSGLTNTTTVVNTPSTNHSSCIINLQKIGCLGEGTNEIKIIQKSPTFTCTFSNRNEIIYPLSSHGNYKDNFKYEFKSGGKKSAKPENNDTIEVVGCYRVFLGTSESLNAENLTPDEIVNMDLHREGDVLLLDPLFSEKPNEFYVGGSGSYYIYTNKSIVIACPVGFELIDAKSMDMSVIKEFGKPVVKDIKCGGITLKYNVYLYPNLTGAYVEINNMLIKDVRDGK